MGLIWVLILVRIVGLRSFSKMTSFDFVMTVAMGSLLSSASQVGNWIDYVQALGAMTGLFAIQFGLARLRQSSGTVEKAISNEPVMLMRDGVIFDDALRNARVSRADLIAKLREANVLQLSDVRAAVLETTGDVAVLHGDYLDEILLDGVRLPN